MPIRSVDSADAATVAHADNEKEIKSLAMRLAGFARAWTPSS